MSVESAMECQVRVHELFCAVSLTSTMLSKRFCRQRKPSVCGPKHCPFSRTSNGWGLAGVVLNELCLELVPQPELKLDCAVQHCLVVVTSQPASVRRRVVQKQKNRLGFGCGHHVLVHHLDPLFTVDFQARSPRSATSVQRQERPLFQVARQPNP